MTTPQTASQPAPTATTTVTATRVIVATATPTATATATRVIQPTATPSPTATNTASPSPTAAKSGYQEGFTERGEPFRGDPAAPVVFEEFSSYQCGFCGKYFRETFPQVIANYVETGQVLYVFRDFPLPGQPQSPLAAEVANCAGKMGDGSTYWAMHDVLFERQTEWSGKGNAKDIFKGYAKALELDETAFGQCLDSRATRDQAEADVAEGIARGVRGTPTFFVDGQPLVGAQPYSVIAQAIDAALAGKTGADTALKLAPISALSSDVRQLPAKVQEAYRFALANPDVLDVIPCYCGCNQVGHENNRMCYVQSETADGQVVFDSHALG
jgi:protein-disulfide isomerase